MPHEIAFDMLPAGYSMNAGKQGDTIKVRSLEFSSSEDGHHFVQRLEGFPAEILAKLPEAKRPLPSTVDHLLAVIRRDRSATVYVNELCISATIRPKRRLEAGERVWRDDVADVMRVQFQGLRIPPTTGVVFLFSVGWRKGLFFDMHPLGDSAAKRSFDLEVLLGQYYTYILFQDLFRITDPEWEILFSQQWFPFVALKQHTVQQMISHVRNGWSADELLPQLAEEVRNLLDGCSERWSSNHYFGSHCELLKHAAERFISGDFISATAIIYPRIEGVLRTFQNASGIPCSRKQTQLLNCALSSGAEERHAMSILLPERFRRYVTDIYYGQFNPGDPDIKLSRHSVAHGVAKPEDFSLKAACIGFLILEQLWYYLRPA